MKRRWLWLGAAAAAGAFLLSAAVLLQSDWLRERLRLQAIAAVRNATGSRVSLERLEINWLTLTVRLDGFTLDGLPREGEQPLFHASRITAGLAVHPFSSRQLSLREVRVEQPRVFIYHRDDGSTNFPQPPRPRREGPLLEDLVRLRIGLLELQRAHFELNDRSIDFDLRLEGFGLGLAYDFRQTRYRLQLAAERTALPWGLQPSLLLEGWLAADAVELTRASASFGDSKVEWTASVRDLRHPRVEAEYRASVLLRDLEISPVRQGFAISTGAVRIEPGQPPRIEGSLRAEQLALSGPGFQVRRLDARGSFSLTPDLLELQPLEIASPYLAWRGALKLRDWRDLVLEGRAEEASLLRLQAVLPEPLASLDAKLSGPASVRLRITPEGPRDTEVRAALEVAPVEGALPLEGNVQFAWRQNCACVEFGESSLATRSLRASFRGTLGQSLEAGVYASSLAEVSPLLAALGAGDIPALPVTLDQGALNGTARLEGPLDDLRISGSLSASRAVYEDIPLERVQARFALSSRRLQIEPFTLRQSAGQLSGSLALGLKDWRPDPDGPLRAALEINRADLPQLLRLARLPGGIRGVAAGAIELNGTLGRPHGSLRLSVENAAWGEETLGRVALDASLDPAGRFRLLATRNSTRLQADGVWKHEPDDLLNGHVQAQASVAGFRTADFAFFRDLALPLDALFEARATLGVRIENGAPRLSSIDGALTSPGLRLGSVAFEPLRIDAETKDGALSLRARLDAKPAPVEASASVQLERGWPARFRLKWPALSVGLLHRLLKETGRLPSEPLPFSGAFDVEIDGEAELAELRGLSGRITIPNLELRPAPEEAKPEVPLPRELFLRNSGPLVFEFDDKAVRVRQAQFAALETDLTLSGAYEFTAPAPWNLEARGVANLAVLGSFYPELTAGGAGRLRAVLRGEAAEPQLSGQMEIVKASFYLRDLPIGLDDVNGTIFFDRNRANIQKLTGVSGGGTASLSGFVGLARGDLTFRLQAQLANVRLRYPEGVSNTIDADLALTGSSAASVLSGLVTVKRSGFIVTGDAGSLLGGAGGPLPAAAQNEFLRNLQFDVRLRTAPNAIFSVSYTSDLQLEGDLRLRGSPAKPILLGSIYASQGEVNFFGNRYNISRGEILFYNTAAVAPQIDLDLETRVRGITVYINVSGPLSRLNITYRSEPPLQSSEILALLTVGRTPAATSGSMVATDRIRSQTVMENSAGSNTLLGTALTAGLNTRTERFFGASRLRIDPSNVGVDALPQARLSIEQSISRDVTLTFITNLNRSQQQVVRLEWDLSRQWSVIAIKDENGAFAVDFLFRKRFR
jgi:translocation and assembly module TamB